MHRTVLKDRRGHYPVEACCPMISQDCSSRLPKALSLCIVATISLHAVSRPVRSITLVQQHQIQVSQSSTSLRDLVGNHIQVLRN